MIYLYKRIYFYLDLLVSGIWLLRGFEFFKGVSRIMFLNIGRKCYLFLKMRLVGKRKIDLKNKKIK